MIMINSKFFFFSSGIDHNPKRSIEFNNIKNYNHLIKTNITMEKNHHGKNKNNKPK